MIGNIEKIYPRGGEIRKINGIVRAVAKKWDLTPQMILGRSRKQPVAFARQLCMALAYHKTGYSLVDVGEHFGNRHHGSVIHAIKVVDKACRHKRMAAIVEEILQNSKYS